VISNITFGARTKTTAGAPLVIAELSGNHNGSLDTALKIVDAVARAGADAIKLQTFTPATLTINSRRPEFFIDDPGGLWHGRRLWDLYEEAHTPWDWHEPLFRAARGAGLLCMSSAFDDSSVEFLVSLGVDAIKIASFELVHLPLVGAAARSGVPLIVSTGMAALDEIEQAVTAIRETGDARFVLLKCTSAYPADNRDADLLTMVDLQSRFRCPVGLSDHTLTPFAAYAATALGAAVIEKHVTLSRSAGGVDAAFSLEPAELRELVDGILTVAQTRGQIRYGPKSAERVSLRERPSIYVVRNVRKGEVFDDTNLRIIRPAGGLPPRVWAQVVGRSSTRDIEAEVPLSWDLVDAVIREQR
jgi:pseudaminic acid synthase